MERKRSSALFLARVVRSNVGSSRLDRSSLSPFRSGVTKLKHERPPVNRINSYPSRSSSAVSRRSSSRPLPDSAPENIEDTCLLCTAGVATHEYDPCRHCPMCGECFAKLECQQLELCMICHRPATIRIRVPTTPSTH